MSLGHAAYIGVAGYTCILLTVAGPASVFGLFGLLIGVSVS